MKPAVIFYCGAVCLCFACNGGATEDGETEVSDLSREEEPDIQPDLQPDVAPDDPPDPEPADCDDCLPSCGDGLCEGAETCLSCPGDCRCPVDIIPGVKGFAETRGPFEAPAGNPAICVVDDLAWSDDPLVEDPSYGGSSLTVLRGNLRRCLVDREHIAADRGRIIVFEAAGTINAHGPYQELRLRDLEQEVGSRGIGYLWVAGQTAPPPGITLYNIKIMPHGSHTIWQHLRFRLDDNYDPDSGDLAMSCLQAQSHKAFQVIAYPDEPEPEHTIFDHNSVSYGIDNLVTFGDYSTVTNNILAYALDWSVHPKTFDYGAASASCPGDCECQYDPASTNGHSKGVMLVAHHHAALIGNILAFNEDRNPLIQGGTTDVYVANNIIHRADFPIMISDESTPQTVTAVGNMAQLIYAGFPNFATLWRDPFMPGSRMYFEDNLCHGVPQSSADDWSGVRLASGVTDASKITDPALSVSVDGFIPLGHELVKASVLESAGARPADRDAVDALLCLHVEDGTGDYIDKPEDLADPFPHMDLTATRNLYSEMSGSRAGPIPTNPFEDDDGDGRENIVIWLNLLDAEVSGAW